MTLPDNGSLVADRRGFMSFNVNVNQWKESLGRQIERDQSCVDP
jgi:hypothetical protein